MSNNTVTPVPATATVIRAAFKAGRFTAPEVALDSLLGKNRDGSNVRGRIHPAAQKALIEACPGEFTEVNLGNSGERQVKAPTLVTVPRVNAKGRALAPTVMTRAEVLALAGLPADRKGALSKETLAKAGAAHVASGAKVTKAAKTEA